MLPCKSCRVWHGPSLEADDTIAPQTQRNTKCRFNLLFNDNLTLSLRRTEDAENNGLTDARPCPKCLTLFFLSLFCCLLFFLHGYLMRPYTTSVSQFKHATNKKPNPFRRAIQFVTVTIKYRVCWHNWINSFCNSERSTNPGAFSRDRSWAHHTRGAWVKETGRDTAV